MIIFIGLFLGMLFLIYIPFVLQKKIFFFAYKQIKNLLWTY